MTGREPTWGLGGRSAPWSYVDIAGRHKEKAWRSGVTTQCPSGATSGSRGGSEAAITLASPPLQVPSPHVSCVI